MECIVHFEVMHPEGPKPLRGLIYLGEGEAPQEQQLIDMFKDMKFDVRLADRERLIFEPVSPNAGYSQIRITDLDTGKPDSGEDQELKQIIGQLLPKRPTGL
ncbi:hypothetical protein F4V43_18235 [Paenibacillus spiritus]|uniref:Uncharacterized protein n=1 Tax=Paenibacillus spiritus TaxID=2496557 RepID=A0A5J5FUM1_9BACL|nr:MULTISPECIES: hypothetical protein [Paenibacillus]KAA8997229.1 hypothetical protein F4V43_18235 [Paenibacillus spiritus]